MIFDNNYRARLWPGGRAEACLWYKQAYASCDLALITLEDNQTLFDIADREEAIRHACSLPPPEVVIKCGAEPTLICLAGEAPVSVPVFKVTNVVDTTGAGDSFAGAYLAARLQGLSPEVSARSGNKLASIVIQHAGAIIPAEAMPVFVFL